MTSGNDTHAFEQFRKIDIGKRVRRPKLDSSAPDMISVPIRDLIINDAYQRPILKRGWRQIEAIAENFDWGLFVPAVVSPVGSKFALIDGQHRAHAAYLAGFDEIPAISVEMTAGQQARAFAAINTQITRMSPSNVFKAALAAREPWALDAELAVANAGCRLMPYNKSASLKKPGEIFSVTLIRKHIEAGEGELVTACLSAIRTSDEAGEPAYYVGTVVKAFFEAVGSNVQFLRNMDLDEFCKDVDLLDLHDAAASEAAQTRQPKGPLFRRRIIAAIEDFRSREAA